VTAMIEKYFNGVVPPDNGEVFAETDWKTICSAAVECSLNAMESFSLQEAVESAMSIVRQVDLYINTTAPFKLAKDETKQAELGTILYQCIEALRIASMLLHPVIPVKMDELHQAIGVEMPRGNSTPTLAWGGMQAGTTIQKIALFPRVEFASSE